MLRPLAINRTIGVYIQLTTASEKRFEADDNEPLPGSLLLAGQTTV